MRELREDTFSRNKNDDACEHVERFLDIISLFNIPVVTHDAFMLKLLCKGTVHYQRPPSSLKTSVPSSRKKVNIFYNGKSIMNRQLLDSQGPIPGMTHAQALKAIQTMADHSQKWHDGSSSRSINNNNSKTEGITAIVSKLDSLGRDMKKLKENVHAIYNTSIFDI
ncbi:hypothetical protein Tco_1524429 [Tanacetum coccineum]